MKKFIVGILSGALLVFLLAGTAGAQVRFGFRTYGGLSYLSTGDVNKGVESWSDFYKIIYLHDYTTSDKYKPLNLGLDFGGELLIQFSPQFALGLGSGYITASKNFEMNFRKLGELPVTYTSQTKMGAIPIRLSLYYFLAVGPGISVSLHAGTGYYLANLDFLQRIETSAGFEEIRFDTKGGGLGFHGGFGLEIALSSMISLVFDLTGRFASFSNFTGDQTIAVSGFSLTERDLNVYFLKINEWPYGTFSLLYLNDTTPSGPEIISADRAKVSFSGFSSFIGFLFRF